MIYALQCQDSGRIKIGFTKDRSALRRLRACQMGCPSELAIVAEYPDGDRGDEAMAHRLLGTHHIRGEWFAPHDEVIDVVGVLAGRAPRSVAGVFLLEYMAPERLGVA